MNEASAEALGHWAPNPRRPRRDADGASRGALILGGAWSLRPRAANLPRVRSARLALPALLAAALVACGGADSPEEIALEFWTAAAAHDYRAAEPYSNAGDTADVEAFLGSFSPKRSPAIGEAMLSEDRALVETVFLVGDSREPLSFSTHLLRAGDAWRVDLAATSEEMLRARVALPAERAKESLETLENGADPASAKAAAGQLRRAADEIEEAVAEEPASAP